MDNTKIWKQDKYVILTHSFIRNKQLTMQEKIFYMEILNLSSTDHGCFASNNHFEKSFGVSKKSASNTISSLVKKGVISVDISNRNHKRLLSIKDGQVSIKDGQPSTKSGETIDNNTTNNTYNTPFEKFTSELEELFEDNKIATHKSKINKTSEVKKYFVKIKDTHDLDKIKKDFVLYVKLNQNTASRLSKYLIAVYEDNISGLPYSDKKNKPDSGQWESVDM